MCLEDIIAELSEHEREAMIVLGHLCMSKNKTFREETLRNKLPPAFKTVNVRRLLKDLEGRRLVGRYRPRQWRMTSDGFRVAQFLWEERRRDMYPGMSFE